MRESEIDYQAVFQALPSMVALFTPGLEYADVNEAFLRGLGRRRDQVVGHGLADAFPDDPRDPGVTGMRKLRDSLRWVAATGERDAMTLHRYDVESPDRPGVWEERYWSTVCVPVLGADGRVAWLLHWEQDLTELVRNHGGRSGAAGRATVLEAELYRRARELQEVNERLRKAHAREREVALHLQEAMLPVPDPLPLRHAAVRYRPAVGFLNVCGDWYDLVDRPDGRVAVAVGDVVGSGLVAACVMGQLRSALSAACRVADHPARALEALDLYARSVDGAESTTATLAVIDHTGRTISYSSAGHLPAALMRPDGTVDFLDGATDPPLGARPEHADRLQRETAFTEGSVLVLYTDGLVERRGEDIDAGLARLADSLARHRGGDPDALADALLADLTPPAGATDDTALVVLGL
ncbi:PP2C family protein-serine/threonine phosphatase [Streptomyces sp. AC512_CC834]|uniref:PP2C family protein-serine/threonine phosphatase n=1 Tax=Streptomyces sp. AC512_CC834 TaxID=2823691 RepID=UPI001C27D8C8|nr:SpoIIE family protein phosphatase [Streptomyces sp. AC512_CC834]